MKFTKDILEQGKSKKGSWSKAQLECLGLTYPLISGWKLSLYGKELPDEVIKKFLELKDKHILDYRNFTDKGFAPFCTFPVDKNQNIIKKTSLYKGKTPPWKFKTYIDCKEDE